MELIQKHFPSLSKNQLILFQRLQPLYEEWNAKINVISRKDMEHLMIRHVLHSLGIGKIIQFKPETRVLDVGTGGGFPGIPLAIMFPDAHFHLVDSIGKKIKVVEAIVESLKLNNVTYEQNRVEQLKGEYHFIVSRAVKSLPVFYKWVSNRISDKHFNDSPNGIMYIKGGDFTAELKSMKRKSTIYPLRNYFDDPFYETKSIVHIY